MKGKGVSAHRARKGEMDGTRKGADAYERKGKHDETTHTRAQASTAVTNTNMGFSVHAREFVPSFSGVTAADAQDEINDEIEKLQNRSTA